MNEIVQVIVADDHASVRSGLVMILSSDPNIEVVGQGANGSEALQLCVDLKPQVAVLDIRMPGRDGVWAAEQIRSQTRTKPLMLTTYDDHSLVQQALNSGAHGYLLKTATGPELIAAVHHVAQGRHVVDPAITGALIRAYQEPREQNQENRVHHEQLLARLTPREIDVVRLIASGKTNHQIGKELSVSLATVKTHISSIYQKTHLQSRVQLGFLGKAAL